MALTTRPLFVLCVMWHPAYAHGRAVADGLRQHFRRDLHRSVAGEPGISVLERSDGAPGSRVPLAIDWDDAELTAVVALTEAGLVGDPEWAGYVREVAGAAHARGLPAAFFPVAMDGGALELGCEQQALRWDRWGAPDEARLARLTRELTHEFCRMLRQRVEEQRPGDGGAVSMLGRYLENVRVFISHSKHDADGRAVARGIRGWIHEHGPVDSFFDVHDIPPGMSFEDVLLHYVGTSAMVAVHTDTFTARPPELIALASPSAVAEGASRTIVYPEPLLGTDDERLFSEIAPTVRLLTLERWLEER